MDRPHVFKSETALVPRMDLPIPELGIRGPYCGFAFPLERPPIPRVPSPARMSTGLSHLTVGVSHLTTANPAKIPCSGNGRFQMDVPPASQGSGPKMLLLRRKSQRTWGFAAAVPGNSLLSG